MAKPKQAAKESESLGPTLEFMRTVWALNHALEVTSKRMEVNLGVTAQQRMMVRLIGKYPGATAGRIAELLRVHRATVSVALNRLEKRGLIKRGRDESDYRRVTVTLTKRGQALDVPAKGTVENAVDSVLAKLPARDVIAARRAMTALSEELEQGDATVDR